jgi:hypothetical protein
LDAQVLGRPALCADRPRRGAARRRRRTVPFHRTHDLGKLGAQVVALDFSVTPYVERIVELTKYAWVFRYPGDPQDPSPEEALLALSVVQDLVEVILGRLPDDARP